MRPARLITALATSLLALALVAPLASARVYDLHELLGDRVARVAAKTPVPVRFPATLDLDFDGKVYVDGTGGRKSWGFGLAGAPKCGNATACFLAEITGERDGTPAFRTRVRLRGGRN